MLGVEFVSEDLVPGEFKIVGIVVSDLQEVGIGANNWLIRKEKV